MAAASDETLRKWKVTLKPLSLSFIKDFTIHYAVFLHCQCDLSGKWILNHSSFSPPWGNNPNEYINSVSHSHPCHVIVSILLKSCASLSLQLLPLSARITPGRHAALWPHWPSSALDSEHVCYAKCLHLNSLCLCALFLLLFLSFLLSPLPRLLAAGSTPKVDFFFRIYGPKSVKVIRISTLVKGRIYIGIFMDMDTAFVSPETFPSGLMILLLKYSKCHLTSATNR